MKNVNMNPDAKLSFLERFAYGIGDYAGNWCTLQSVHSCWYITQT